MRMTKIDDEWKILTTRTIIIRVRAHDGLCLWSLTWLCVVELSPWSRRPLSHSRNSTNGFHRTKGKSKATYDTSVSTGIQSTEEFIKNKAEQIIYLHRLMTFPPCYYKKSPLTNITSIWSQQWIEKIHQPMLPAITHLTLSTPPWARFLAVLHCLAWWAAPSPSNSCLWVAIRFWHLASQPVFAALACSGAMLARGGKDSTMLVR